MRTKCDDKTRLELDSIDARITFNSSTGVALIIICSLLIFQDYLNLSNTLIDNEDFIRRGIVASLIVFSGMLFITSSYAEAEKVRLPLICNLLKEHNIELSEELSKKCK